LNLGPEPADLFNVPTSVATLRASDEDRDATIRVLNDAASVGRLTTEEHADRVETALRAQTLGDLAALTADLAPPTTRRTFPIRRLVLGAIVIIVAAVSGDLIVAQHGTSAAIQTTTSAGQPPVLRGVHRKEQHDMCGERCSLLGGLGIPGSPAPSADPVATAVGVASG
jgi:hypothetical protein